MVFFLISRDLCPSLVFLFLGRLHLSKSRFSLLDRTGPSKSLCTREKDTVPIIILGSLFLEGQADTSLHFYNTTECVINRKEITSKNNITIFVSVS